MWKKTGFGIIIVLSFYGFLLLHAPSESIKRLGYNRLLNVYAESRLRENDIEILYNPGLRKLDIDLQQAKVYSHLPQQEQDYSRVMEAFLASDRQVIVECSALDSWHSSQAGSAYLKRLRSKAYRVVIFDGGHHLPTLGLAPDIIIVPVYKGYAAHGYMQDGMKVATLRQLLQRSHSRTVLITVSRWRLVKTKNSLNGITQQVLQQMRFSQAEPEPLQLRCQARMSKNNAHLFIYVNREYARNPGLLVRRCRQLGLEDVKQVWLAFDYAELSLEQADQYTKTLQKKLDRDTIRVNEPYTVMDLLLTQQRNPTKGRSFCWVPILKNPTKRTSLCWVLRVGGDWRCITRVEELF